MGANESQRDAGHLDEGPILRRHQANRSPKRASLEGRGGGGHNKNVHYTHINDLAIPSQID
jgi:hypothetical protein